jgi:hypothetical protein
MAQFGKILVSGAIGAGLGAVFSFLGFVLLALLDSTSVSEAIAFGILVGFVGAFVGFMIGIAVRIGNVGLLGGGVIGAVATLLLMLLYALVIGRPGEFGYFLSESRIILLVMGLPSVASGVITAFLNRVLSPA